MGTSKKETQNPTSIVIAFQIAVFSILVIIVFSQWLAIGSIWVAIASSILTCGVILIYYKYIKRKFPTKDNSESKKRADSVYFLGFLATLLALIVALGFGIGSKADVLAATIAQSAIALSSTAVALYLRQIWIFQIQEEDIGELDLRKLRGEFSNLGRSIVALQDKSSNLGETFSDSGVVIEEQVKVAGVALGNVATRLNELDLNPDLITQNITRLCEEIDELIRKNSTDQQKQCVDFIEKINKELSQLQDFLKGSFQEEEFEKLISSLENSSRALEEISLKLAPKKSLWRRFVDWLDAPFREDNE